jgi:RES domain-containing protein
MAEFASARSYHRFQQSVQRKSRYMYDGEIHEFLETVIATSESRKHEVKKGTVLWRAQRGYIWRKENEGQEEEFRVPGAFSPERMRPNAEFAGDGRVNPRGIPCLYLASSEDTAMAEVRPWLGAYVSLAQFKVMRDCAVIDCSSDTRKGLWIFNGEPDAERREKIVWGDIAHALSKPVTPDESAIEYVPTQVIAEAFRAHGFDGIIYKSLLGKGLSVALFNCEAAELINCALHETTAIEYKFQQCDNAYFVSKHYPELQKKRTVDAPPTVLPADG